MDSCPFEFLFNEKEKPKDSIVNLFYNRLNGQYAKNNGFVIFQEQGDCFHLENSEKATAYREKGNISFHITHYNDTILIDLEKYPLSKIDSVLKSKIRLQYLSDIDESDKENRGLGGKLIFEVNSVIENNQDVTRREVAQFLIIVKKTNLLIDKLRVETSNIMFNRPYSQLNDDEHNKVNFILPKKFYFHRLPSSVYEPPLPLE